MKREGGAWKIKVEGEWLATEFEELSIAICFFNLLTGKE
jgi:hypothetical protein